MHSCELYGGAANQPKGFLVLLNALVTHKTFKLFCFSERIDAAATNAAIVASHVICCNMLTHV